MKTKKRNKSQSSTKKISYKNDFYTYINNEWLKYIYIPNNDGYINMFSILQKKVDNQIIRIINKEREKKTKEGRDISNLYNSVYHFNNELSKQQFYYLYQTLQDHLSNGSLNDFIKWTILSGIEIPINISITYNVYNTKTNNIVLTHPPLLYLKDNYLKKDKKSIIMQNKYKIFLTVLFRYVFGKDHQYDVNKILDIEMLLAKYVYNPIEQNNIDTHLNFYKQDDIFNNFYLDYKNIFEMYNIKNDGKKIQVYNPTYIKEVGKVFKKEWNTSKWNEYWIYQVLKVYSMLNSNVHDIFFSFMESVLNGKKQKKTKSYKAMVNVCSYFNIYINELYIKYYKNEKEIMYARHLTGKVKDIFIQRLKHNTWLDKKTIEKALLKLTKMGFIIGFNDWEPQEECLSFTNDNYYENYKKYISSELKLFNHYLHKKNNNKWVHNNGINSFVVNAFYNGSFNEIILPNAILQPPFVDVSKPLYYNLAFIGATIGHEIIHAFDDEGSKLDENGNYHNWWSDKDKEEYKNKQKLVIKLYEDMGKNDNIQLNGELSLGENIADIYGFKICEELLTNDLIEKKIYGKEQYPYFKELYKYYAISWKNKMNCQLYDKQVHTNVHSLAKYRVNGVLMNSKRYQDIYGLLPSDKMYNSVFIDIW